MKTSRRPKAKKKKLVAKIDEISSSAPIVIIDPVLRKDPSATKPKKRAKVPLPTADELLGEGLGIVPSSFTIGQDAGDRWAADMRSIDEITPYVRNPRRNDAAVDAVARSIREFGFQQPIVVDAVGVIIVGHTRWKAAKQLGLIRVPVRVAVDLTPTQAKAYRLADNRTSELAIWDPELLPLELGDLAALDVDLGDLGFDTASLEKIVSDARTILAPLAVDREPEDEVVEEDEGAIAGLPPIPEEAQKAPFPWFGGKRRVAGVIWQAFDDVSLYVEPFAGSLATLLARPVEHENRIANVNDKDAYVANFWRAMKAAPAEVAEYADGPVNETDLLARHRWLVATGKERLAALESDPEHYDAKVAGWWCWGLAQWIGGGWCSGRASGREETKRPHIGDSGHGVHRQLPHISNFGQGVHRKLQKIGGSDQGACVEHRAAVTAWFRDLADRLRHVRVCCGDWSRVCTLGATASFGTVGVMLDPPYGDGSDRDMSCYATDDQTGKLAGEVRAWALRAAEDPRLRIALCGYEEEHQSHMPGWRVVAWKTRGTMQRRASKGKTKTAKNMQKERIWLSPSCDPVLVDGRRIDLEVT